MKQNHLYEEMFVNFSLQLPMFIAGDKVKAAQVKISEDVLFLACLNIAVPTRGKIEKLSFFSGLAAIAPPLFHF